MAIDRSLEPLLGEDPDASLNGLVVEEESLPPEDTALIEMDDGSVVVDFDPMAMEGPSEDRWARRARRA